MTKFVGPSYRLNTYRADVQRSVNLMVARAEVAGEKTPERLVATPGLSVFSGDGRVGALFGNFSTYLLQENGGRILL